MKKMSFILLAVGFLLLFAVPAMAAELTLPTGLKEIEAEAFMGDTSLDTVILPDGIESIGEKAFANSGVKRIYLPGSISFIADNAFSGCENVIGYGDDGTKASRFFDEHEGLTFEREEEWISSPIENFSFEAIDEFTCKLTGYAGSEKHVIIPEKNADGLTVVELDYPAFDRHYGADSCDNVESVTIPSTIQAIYPLAFRMESICNIYVSDDNAYFKSIDGVLFNKDQSLLIRFPSGKDLTSYTIPEGVSIIGNLAFESCYNLTDIILPDSLIDIGNDAFYVGIKKLQIPKNVTNISTMAFTGCYNLEYINVAAENENYTSIDGVLFSKDQTVLLSYPRNRQHNTYFIPNTVTNIAPGAFYCNYYLREVKIPNSVVEIGYKSFCYVESMHDIVIPDSITEIPDFCFSRHEPLTITVSDKITFIDEMAFGDCTSLTICCPEKSYAAQWAQNHNIDIVYTEPEIRLEDFTYEPIDETTCRITGYTGDNVSLTLPSQNNDNLTVTEIGDHAFSNCETIVNVSIPETVTTISDYAFYNCKQLQSITFSESILTIGDNVFYGCPLKSYQLSKNISSIGKSFYNYIPIYVEKGSVTESTLLSAGYTRIVSYTDYFDSSATPVDEFDFTIQEDGTIKIKDYWGNNPNIIIPVKAYGRLVTSVVFAGYDMYDWHNYERPSRLCNIQSIHLPATIDNFGLSWLKEEERPTCEIIIDEDNPRYEMKDKILYDKINHSVVFALSDIVNATIAEGTTEIDYSAFQDCTLLENVDMPWTLSYIQTGAFRGCTKLKQLVLTEKIDRIYSICDNCDSLTSIYIPPNVTRISGSFENVTIYGIRGSAAEAYALEYGYTFVGLGDKDWYPNMNDYNSASVLSYKILDDDTVEITGTDWYAVGTTELIIPQYIMKRPVTRIADRACSDLYSMASIKVPNSIKYIGDFAFSSCYKLEKCNLPGSVNYIGIDAFRYNDNLLLYGYKNSYAESWANEHNIPFSTDPMPGMDDYSDVSLAGQVIAESGSALSDVLVIVAENDNPDNIIATVRTDRNGHWSIDSLPGDSDYLVSFYHEDYIFNSDILNPKEGDAPVIGTLSGADNGVDVSFDMWQNGEIVSSIVVGTAVDFTIDAPGASYVRLVVDGVAYEEYSLDDNGHGQFTRTFSKSGERQVAFQTLKLQEYSFGAISGMQLLKVTAPNGSLNAVSLEIPQIEAIGSVEIHQTFTAKWRDVDLKEAYHVYLYDGKHLLWDATTSENSIRVPAIEVEGTYTLLVVAFGFGMNQSQSGITFDVCPTDDDGEIIEIKDIHYGAITQIHDEPNKNYHPDITIYNESIGYIIKKGNIVDESSCRINIGNEIRTLDLEVNYENNGSWDILKYDSSWLNVQKITETCLRIETLSKVDEAKKRESTIELSVGEHVMISFTVFQLGSNLAVPKPVFTYPESIANGSVETIHLDSFNNHPMIMWQTQPGYDSEVRMWLFSEAQTQNPGSINSLDAELIHEPYNPEKAKGYPYALGITSSTSIVFISEQFIKENPEKWICVQVRYKSGNIVSEYASAFIHATSFTVKQNNFRNCFSISSSTEIPMLAEESAYLAHLVYDGWNGHLSDESVALELVELGFIPGTIFGYDFGNGTHKSGVVFATQYINGVPLYAIVIRGTIGVDEWVSNFTLGTDAIHEGFNKAAERVQQHFESDYLPKLRMLGYDVSMSEYKMLICGHSRGGAVGNILASEIYSNNAANIYAYLYATPNTTRAPKSSAYNIYNYVFVGDIVPRIPAIAWGYGKSGKIIPITDINFDSSKTTLREEQLNKFMELITAIIPSQDDFVEHIQTKMETFTGPLTPFSQSNSSNIGNLCLFFLEKAVGDLASEAFPIVGEIQKAINAIKITGAAVTLSTLWDYYEMDFFLSDMPNYIDAGHAHANYYYWTLKQYNTKISVQ